MSRVLVTGATGFIGNRTLEPLLAAGYEVHALARREVRVPEVSAHPVDLVRDPAATRSLLEELAPDALLHLAWYAEPGRFWTAPENLSWVGASLGLLRAFAQAGGRRVVMAGTCAEYDWSHELAREHDTPLTPSTLYGAAKNATRLVSESFAAQEGLSLAWGRVFFLYGPGEHEARLVPSVARSLLAGQPARTTAGTQVRDFMHVADVARAFAELLDSDVTGAVNIASGNPRALRELIEAVGRASGRLELLELGALAERPGEPDRLIADARRLRDEVGFVPSMDLEQGVAETVRWWSEQPLPPVG
jgi:nucleoside-diphosphate-sugar epimerase